MGKPQGSVAKDKSFLLWEINVNLYTILPVFIVVCLSGINYSYNALLSFSKQRELFRYSATRWLFFI